MIGHEVGDQGKCNARPHVAKVTKDTILSLGHEVLLHPAYSLDTDFHLFMKLQLANISKMFRIYKIA